MQAPTFASEVLATVEHVLLAAIAAASSITGAALAERARRRGQELHYRYRSENGTSGSSQSEMRS